MGSRGCDAVRRVLDGASRLAVLQLPQRELFRLLPAESVTAVVSDPPYDRGSMGCYADCYRGASRVLRPHGDLLLIMGHYQLDPFGETLRQLLPEGEASALRYRWTLAMVQHDGSWPRLVNGHRNIAVTWKPIGWWYRPGPRPRNYAGTVDSYRNPPPDKQHPWQQSQEWARFCLDHLYHEDGIVVDPMCGSGTVAIEALRRGYRAIVGDIDAAAVDLTLRRIREETDHG